MRNEEVIAALAALAQETRLGVFRLLVRAGAGGLPVGAIGDELGIPAATLSFHLKELRNAGLVSCRCEGTSRIYTPSFARVSELIRFLTANCCAGVSGSGPAPGARRGAARKTAASARRAAGGRRP
ncbi:MAG: metalloregulator ArsR/SmtB family transcription factor [Deltaproteobacteria bacterium]|nr:metalloregulator ArsR/SmtB family transcription factor [Deltaproteobacteria bacterium]